MRNTYMHTYVHLPDDDTREDSKMLSAPRLGFLPTRTLVIMLDSMTLLRFLLGSALSDLAAAAGSSSN